MEEAGEEEVAGVVAIRGVDVRVIEIETSVGVVVAGLDHVRRPDTATNETAVIVSLAEA